MPIVRRLVLFALLCLLLLAAGGRFSQRVEAQEGGRQMTIVVPFTEYEWWLLAFDDNELKCQFKTDHEGLPNGDEVGRYCGAEVQADWLSTPPCDKILKGKGKITACNGLYLLEISSQPKQKEILIDLPIASAGVTLEGCTPEPPENLCQELPEPAGNRRRASPQRAHYVN